MGQAQAAHEFDGFRAHSTESDAPGSIYRLPRITRECGRGGRGRRSREPVAWRDSLTTPRRIAEETRKTWNAARPRAGWPSNCTAAPASRATSWCWRASASAWA
jgi:ATP-dependent helicase/nuclease subunit A